MLGLRRRLPSDRAEGRRLAARRRLAAPDPPKGPKRRVGRPSQSRPGPGAGAGRAAGATNLGGVDTASSSPDSEDFEFKNSL